MLAYVVLFGVLGAVGMAYGHGTGSETLDPIQMDGRMVTMVVSSQQEEGLVQVDLAMVEFDTGEPVRDTLFLITARHGQTQLFSEEFNSDDGKIIFDLIEGGAYTLPERSGGGFFGMLGAETYRMAGPGLADGGLYSFDVVVLSADRYAAHIRVGRLSTHNVP